jgi:hypothetical protein
VASSGEWSWTIRLCEQSGDVLEALVHGGPWRPVAPSATAPGAPGLAVAVGGAQVTVVLAHAEPPPPGAVATASSLSNLGDS